MSDWWTIPVFKIKKSWIYEFTEWRSHMMLFLVDGCMFFFFMFSVVVFFSSLDSSCLRHHITERFSNIWWYKCVCGGWTPPQGRTQCYWRRASMGLSLSLFFIDFPSPQWINLIPPVFVPCVKRIISSRTQHVVIRDDNKAVIRHRHNLLTEEYLEICEFYIVDIS